MTVRITHDWMRAIAYIEVPAVVMPPRGGEVTIQVRYEDLRDLRLAFDVDNHLQGVTIDAAWFRRNRWVIRWDDFTDDLGTMAAAAEDRFTDAIRDLWEGTQRDRYLADEAEHEAQRHHWRAAITRAEVRTAHHRAHRGIA